MRRFSVYSTGKYTVTLKAV